MDPLNKNATLTVRMSVRQLEKLHKAAGIESERRDEKIEPSRLLRELAMKAIDGILTQQQAAAAS
jgi:hypothetical protein